MSTTLCAAEPLKNQAVKLSISHPFEARLWYSAVRNTHTALLDSIALIYEALRLYYIWTCKWVSIYCVLCFVHRVRMKVSSHYVFGGLDKDHHVLFLCVSKWSACNTLYIHNHVKLLKTQTIADGFIFLYSVWFLFTCRGTLSVVVQLLHFRTQWKKASTRLKSKTQIWVCRCFSPFSFIVYNSSTSGKLDSGCFLNYSMIRLHDL